VGWSPVGRLAQAVTARYELIVLVDTHCHLDQRTFPEGVEKVLSRAREASVVAVVAVGSGVAAAREVLELALPRPEVAVVMGVHPHEAASAGGDLGAIAPWLEQQCVVGVGETGLDFHYDYSPRSVQVEVFRRTIRLARRVRKPLVIHTRAAPEETLDILVSEGASEVGGVIHCFSEDQAFAARALELGFDLGFSGLLTFTKARAVRQVAAWAPLDRILVETDSPYLAPVPLRGKRCEPAFVVHTARCLAEARGMPNAVVAEATTANACRRFGSRLADAVGL
jgi:TatD DNase family protein